MINVKFSIDQYFSNLDERKIWKYGNRGVQTLLSPEFGFTPVPLLTNYKEISDSHTMIGSRNNFPGANNVQ